MKRISLIALGLMTAFSIGTGSVNVYAADVYAAESEKFVTMIVYEYAVLLYGEEDLTEGENYQCPVLISEDDLASLGQVAENSLYYWTSLDDEPDMFLTGEFVDGEVIFDLDGAEVPDDTIVDSGDDSVAENENTNEDDTAVESESTGMDGTAVVTEGADAGSSVSVETEGADAVEEGTDSASDSTSSSQSQTSKSSSTNSSSSASRKSTGKSSSSSSGSTSSKTAGKSASGSSSKESTDESSSNSSASSSKKRSSSSSSSSKKRSSSKKKSSSSSSSSSSRSGSSSSSGNSSSSSSEVTEDTSIASDEKDSGTRSGSKKKRSSSEQKSQAGNEGIENEGLENETSGVVQAEAAQETGSSSDDASDSASAYWTERAGVPLAAILGAICMYCVSRFKKNKM